MIEATAPLALAGAHRSTPALDVERIGVSRMGVDVKNFDVGTVRLPSVRKVLDAQRGGVISVQSLAMTGQMVTA